MNSPFADFGTELDDAIARRQWDLARAVLSRRPDGATANHYALVQSIECGEEALAMAIIESQPTLCFFPRYLLLTANSGQAQVIEFLLKFPETDPMANESEAIKKISPGTTQSLCGRFV